MVELYVKVENERGEGESLLYVLVLFQMFYVQIQKSLKCLEIEQSYKLEKVNIRICYKRYNIFYVNIYISVFFCSIFVLFIFFVCINIGNSVRLVIGGGVLGNECGDYQIFCWNKFWWVLSGFFQYLRKICYFLQFVY